MKIGILTFHWATNYGAILQTYALQTFLKKKGHEVYIINYRPKQYKKTVQNCFLTPRFWLYLKNIQGYLKEKKLEVFRKTYLAETILYESIDELKSNPPKLDVYVCGSDQIWNPYFTMSGECKPTSAYFLDFGDESVRRIAYAVSFGCEDYPEAASMTARRYIPNIDAISVREDSGIDIVSKLGIMGSVKLPDPSLLLHKNDYSLIGGNKVTAHKNKKAFVYFIRNQCKDIKNHLKRNYDSPTKLFQSYSVEEWIGGIASSSIVFTNSFHGMVFSLIFHVPFIVFLEKGTRAGMNDRFKTILSYINLEHRIIALYNEDELNLLIKEKIDWNKVDKLLSELTTKSNIFFDKILN